MLQTTSHQFVNLFALYLTSRTTNKGCETSIPIDVALLKTRCGFKAKIKQYIVPPQLVYIYFSEKNGLLFFRKRVKCE